MPTKFNEMLGFYADGDTKSSKNMVRTQKFPDNSDINDTTFLTNNNKVLFYTDLLASLDSNDTTFPYLSSGNSNATLGSSLLTVLVNGTNFLINGNQSGDGVLKIGTAGSGTRVHAGSGVPRISNEVPKWVIPSNCVIFLAAIIGNLLVISTLIQNRRMRTITNVFLLNLAISDMLLGVLCIPATLVGTLLRHFIFGEFFCKLLQFSQAASVAVSSWTLVAISCERYYAICHPLRSRTWQTISHAYRIIGFIWMGSIICMTPIAVFSQLMPTSRQGLKKCREQWPVEAIGYERFYNVFLFVVLLVLPLIILCVAYILITRTLYVGMKRERDVIFGGNTSVNSNSTQFNTQLLDITASEKTSRSSSLKLSLSSLRYKARRSDDSQVYETTAIANIMDLEQPMDATTGNEQVARTSTLTTITDESDGHEQNNKRKFEKNSLKGKRLYCVRGNLKQHSNKRHTGGVGGGTAGGGGDSQAFVKNTTVELCHREVGSKQKPKLTVSPGSYLGENAALRRSNEAKNLESKKRVVKMLFVLVLEFFICWTPLYVVNTASIFIGSTLYEYIDYTTISFFQLLAYSSSCCNPITYCFMNASFRRSFLDTFKGLRFGRNSQCWRKRQRNDLNLSAAGNSIALPNSMTVVCTDSPRL